MKHALVTLLGAATVPAILYVFYSAIRTKWPESYVSAAQDVGLVINRSVGRYFLFIAGPVYFVTLIVSTTVDRFRGHALACALLGASIHLSRTQFVHYWRDIRKIHNHTRLPATLVAVSVAGAALAAAFAGSLGPGPFTAVVPPVDEFFKSLWTTVLVALLAVYALHTWGDTSSAWQLVVRSRREVGSDILEFAETKAIESHADWTLVEGVLLAENLQRPAWVRRLERWRAKIHPDGTYGVMQVRSNRPLTDRESITEAIDKHFAGVTLPRDEYGTYEPTELRIFLSRYNPDSNFVDIAAGIIDEIYVPAEPGDDSAAHEEPEHRGDELLDERVELAGAIFTAMAARILAPQEGMVSIASLPMNRLRQLAELVDHLPEVEAPETERMKDQVRDALSAGSERLPE